MGRIGIAAFYGRDGIKKTTYLFKSYCDMVADLGHLPLVLPLGCGCPPEGFCAQIDALVLTGGLDVSPLSYGEEPSPHVSCVSAERDECERELLEAAVRRGLPVFGICRGMEIINVCFGGTLIQHIPAEVPHPVSHLQKDCELEEKIHTVEVCPSVLSRALGERAAVNSYHHQAVKKLGGGFEGVAYAPDGVCEAIWCGERRILAVQWHPERLYSTDKGQRRLIETALGLCGC